MDLEAIKKVLSDFGAGIEKTMNSLGDSVRQVLAGLGGTSQKAGEKVNDATRQGVRDLLTGDAAKNMAQGVENAFWGTLSAPINFGKAVGGAADRTLNNAVNELYDYAGLQRPTSQTTPTASSSQSGVKVDSTYPAGNGENVKVDQAVSMNPATGTLVGGTEVTEESDTTANPEETASEDTVEYTYKKGDTFGEVIKKLGLDTDAGLWGTNGDVAYYTQQLIEQGMLDANGNVKLGVPFKLRRRK